jgi:hypothetical protein
VATVFFLATLGLAFMSNSVSRAQPADTGSVLEKAAPAVPQSRRRPRCLLLVHRTDNLSEWTA